MTTRPSSLDGPAVTKAPMGNGSEGLEGKGSDIRRGTGDVTEVV